MDRRILVAGLFLAVVAVGVSAAATPAAAAADQSGEGEICDFEHPEWREEQTIAGVTVQEERACQPDNPYAVAAATKGTNDVPMDVLTESGLSEDAVRKHTDRDGDGDPDVIEITLEVNGINEFAGEDELARSGDHEIAPGIEPAFWAFTPKTRGMIEEGTRAQQLTRMPSPPIRVEQGDTVRVTLENTHYFPHTIHFHGVDHPFEVDDEGNDGVPQLDDAEPIVPGESHTYEFTPREAGTFFYHCHVVPDVHVLMGLNGMFIVEEDRPNNTVQTFNIGAGQVRHPSEAISENYTAEYDLQYQEVDAELHRISKEENDPRAIAKAMNREYVRAEADPNYFLVNGRSFPYSLRESLVTVEPGEQYRLRVLNGGSETISLHTHGHKVDVEAYDGVEVDDGQEITRDVVGLTAAQRVDLTLNTTTDGFHSYGEGVWFFHDHREQAVTTDGIGPGGTITLIVYDSYLREDGTPDTDADLARFFDEAYYRGEVPQWGHLDPERFGDPPNASDGEGDGESGSGNDVGTDAGRGG